jgi:hypothetical protein
METASQTTGETPLGDLIADISPSHPTPRAAARIEMDDPLVVKQIRIWRTC